MKEDIVRGILNTLEVRQQDKRVCLRDYILSLTINDSKIQLMIEGPAVLAEPLTQLRSYAEDVLRKTYPEISVNCLVTTSKEAKKQSSEKSGIDGVSDVIVVASGKGGVGKSTVSVNLAIALSQKGYKVGLLDADIYGPSLPMMFGIAEKPQVTEDKKLIPLQKYSIACLSMGLMVPQDKAMIWRGPMVQGALQQMLKSVDWAHYGPLDVLIVDMPPGTGDAQLTMVQQIQLRGAVIVSTPQDIALLDAKRGIQMFQQVAVPLLGIIENMSMFVCPHCHKETPVFDHGGAQQTAEKLDIPFLGEIPLSLDVRVGSDEGVPYLVAHPLGDNAQDCIVQSYSKIAENLIQQLQQKQRNLPIVEEV